VAIVRQREPAKTWSLLGDVRKKPTEYEVVTAKLHFHYGRQPSPFELDPNTPINAWYLEYREGSPLQTDDWEGFRDPHLLTYRVYVQRQAEREAYLDNLVDEFERHNHDASLQVDWAQVLDRLYLPARFPIHTLQMTALYMAQMAPSSFMTNVAYFQAADELRRIQWTAYRAKSLSLDHYAELASSEHTRQRWEEDAAWQPLREAVEKMLITYDWGEAFVALNLAVKPVFDEVFNVQLAELARANEAKLWSNTPLRSVQPINSCSSNGWRSGIRWPIGVLKGWSSCSDKRPVRWNPRLSRQKRGPRTTPSWLGVTSIRFDSV
jgi:toluene monooxygenase system protein E